MSQHTQQDVIETLKSAKNLIETKGHTKGTFARAAHGGACGYANPEATCFCSLGAIRRAAVPFDALELDVAAAAEGYLEDSYDGPASITDWNDAPTRTREEVLHTFSLAIQMAEKDLAESAAEALPGAAANTLGVQEVA